MSAGRKVISDNKDWGTPPKYVEAVKAFFGGQIDLDPCSNEWSLVDARVEYRVAERDGLKESWNFKRIFVNPPYGKDRIRGTGIKQWIQRCEQSNSMHGSEVLALVPVAVNTTHWKKHVFGKARSLCFLADTRLKFLVNGTDGGKGAPMACCMIYWGTDHERFVRVFHKYGAVVPLDELQRNGHAHSVEAEHTRDAFPNRRIGKTVIPNLPVRYPGHETNKVAQLTLMESSKPARARKATPVSYSKLKRKK
ncbi:MAG: DNA N-6-adenine-methyltransferase [Verrucomicrobia bacterium]|nr:DNA N-6-adenine-methyltransferase [Verrucomicrobiota bacterium]